MSEWISVNVNGAEWRHKKPGPWQVETFKSGLCCVTNATGVNWCTRGTGQVLHTPESGEQIAAAINATHL